MPKDTRLLTAPVHEAYLRLVGPAADRWRGRGHLFAAAEPGSTCRARRPLRGLCGNLAPARSILPSFGS